jgi:hypothetical protein
MIPTPSSYFTTPLRQWHLFQIFNSIACSVPYRGSSFCDPYYDDAPSTLQPYSKSEQFDPTHLHHSLLFGPQLTPVCFHVIFLTHDIHFFVLLLRPLRLQDPYKSYDRDFVAKHPAIKFDHNCKRGGMSLWDAMDGKYQGLWGRDDPMFCSSISLWIQVRMFANTLQVALIVSTFFFCLKIKGYAP